MRYAYTIYYVEDVEATLAFYTQAFGFDRKFITPEGDYGELLTGETTLAFASYGLGEANFSAGFEKMGPRPKPYGVELAFTSEAVESDFQRAIEAGATVFEHLVEKPWGQKVGYLRDLNGFLIEICTPMGNQET